MSSLKKIRARDDGDFCVKDFDSTLYLIAVGKPVCLGSPSLLTDLAFYSAQGVLRV